MAHQTHNIPWHLVASHLKFISINPYDDTGYTNLHLRYEDNQGTELLYFINAFIRTLKEHSTCERRKYPEKYDPPSREDVLLNDDVVRKIGPTIYRDDLDWCWRLGQEERSTYRATLCRHEDEVICSCTIPYRERKASSFLRNYEHSSEEDFAKVNGPGFFNLEVVKALLLHGEMDIILRVCAHPNAGLKTWWPIQQDSRVDYTGQEDVCEMALMAYICLNVVYCFPEIWDPASGKDDVEDCRQTKCYQYMLRDCTLSGMPSTIGTYPHRDFFGIEKGQFELHTKLRDQQRWDDFVERNRWRDYDDPYPYGSVSIDDFLTIEKLIGYQPDVSDVAYVRWMLCRKGLPLELAMDVMDIAEYTPRRRLKVANDPLDPDNRDELEKYIDYCWQLLIRCEMMAEAAGLEFPWRQMIAMCMVLFWSCRRRCCVNGQLERSCIHTIFG